MTAPGSARSALAYAITRPDLYRIYPDALKLAAALPPPVFDADRRLQELDRLEKE